MNTTREMQAATIQTHRADVAAIVRSFVPPEHHEAALQEGTIGVLLALEKHTPAAGPFWPFARPIVELEIIRWLQHEGTDLRRSVAKRCESYIESLRDVQSKLKD